MDVAHPYTALTGALKGQVLGVLSATTKPLSGRQIARMIPDGSDRGVRLVLARLAEHGLVEVTEAPPALLYVLNREHLAAPVVEAMMGLRQELLRRLRAAVSAWEVQPLHVSLFGSAARGDGGTDSDIDLFVVRAGDVDAENEPWRAQLDDLAQQVRRWTGNHAGLSEVGQEDLPRLGEVRPAVLEDLRRDGITLVGASVRRLLSPQVAS